MFNRFEIKEKIFKYWEQAQVFDDYLQWMQLAKFIEGICFVYGTLYGMKSEGYTELALLHDVAKELARDCI